MNISPLIKRQEIIIDSHRRNYSANWDNQADDIHLHKKSLDKGKGKYTIKVPLNSDRGASFTDGAGNNAPIPNWIKKEINNALGDKLKREKFVKDVVTAIKNYNDKHKTQEQKARQAMGNIKRAFGLEFPRYIIKGWIRNSLRMYAQFFEIQGTLFHVVLFPDKPYERNDTCWKAFFFFNENVYNPY